MKSARGVEGIDFDVGFPKDGFFRDDGYKGRRRQI